MNHVVEIPAEDLPYWMRQAQRGWDWGFLLALMLSILAAWPFIVRPGLPRTNASENYVFMVTDYADALREGRLYPRWSPHVLSGYGAPIPNYFPPAAPYTAALIKVLFTNDPVRAVRIVFCLGFFIAGAATYAFVKRQTTAAGGLLSVVLFLYNPYMGYTLPYVLGDLSLFLALALLPLLLWTLDRLLVDNRPTDSLYLALSAALLILANPLIAAAGVALGVMLILYHCTVHAHKTWPWALLSLGFGIGLAGFFWIPALFEHDLVRWIERPTLLSIHAAALFNPLNPVDLNALIPEPQLTLGRALLPINLLAFLSILLVGKRSLIHGLFMLAAAGFLLLGSGPLPHATWLLGTASLCLAVGTAALVPVRVLLPPKWRRIYPAFLLTLGLILALPVLHIPHWPSDFGDAEPLDQIAYEQQGAGIAVLPPGYPLPLTLPEILPPNRLLLSGYEADNINKIIPIQSTNRSQINLISHETHRLRYQVTANARTPVSVLTAYFPGWEAFAAGQSIPVTADPRTGLITFDIPPMNGELVVVLGPTQLRTLAWIISGGTALVLLGLTWRRARQPHEHLDESDLLDRPEARLNLLIVAAFALITFVLVTPGSPIKPYVPAGYGLQEAIPARFDTNVGLEILGYDIDRTEARPGDLLQVTLYWQALRTLAVNYQVQISLSEYTSGTVYAQTTLHAPGDYPTSRWRTYLYVKDTDMIRLPDNLQPGSYGIAVDVFDCSPNCGSPLTFFNANGQNVGQTLVLPLHIDVVP